MAGSFVSTYRKVWNHSPLKFPDYSGTRVMTMLVRLSMPSNGPWFEGYTENPCGICRQTIYSLPDDL